MKSVTMMMVDGGKFNDDYVERIVRTANHCRRLMTDWPMRLLLHRAPRIECHCDWFIIPRIWHPGAPAFAEYTYAQLLPFLFETSHVLFMQPDGYILHPEKWQDHWLDFDYIGAPWSTNRAFITNPDRRVGNGGFCLQSREFTKAVSTLLRKYPVTAPFDTWVCDNHAAEIERLYWMRFADIETAIHFSFEEPVNEFPDWKADYSFGFHNCKHPGLPKEN